jgi:hypothetical protein
VDRDVLVAFLITAIFRHKVQVISANNNGALHLRLGDNSAQDTSTDGNIRGEWAFLVNVGSFDGLKTGEN